MKDGPVVTSSADDAERERWEKLYRVTFGAIIRAQDRTPNPKGIAKLAERLADAGYDCVTDHHRKRSKK